MDSRGEIDTVVVGSSHGDYGVDPALIENSFNLCTTSQDLHQSALMYAWAARHNSRMRRVIVVYSLFSYGFDCSRSADKGCCVYLWRAFGLRWRQELDDVFWPMNCNARWPTQPPAPRPMDRGFERTNAMGFFSNDPAALANRVSRHLDFSEVRYREPDNLVHLRSILALARRRGDQVLVAIAPARADYRSELPAGVPLFTKVRDLCRRAGVPVVDAFADPAFDYDDFGDWDHMFPAGEGPKKLAALINDRWREVRPGRPNYARALYRLRAIGSLQ